MNAFWVGVVGALVLFGTPILITFVLGRVLLRFLGVAFAVTIAGVGLYYSWPWLSSTVPLLLKEQKLLEGDMLYLTAGATVSAIVLILLLINKKWGWATFLLVAVLLTSVAYKIWGTPDHPNPKTATGARPPSPQPVRYEVRWTKPPGVNGALPRVRERCMPATVVRMDGAFIRIEAAYLEHGRRETVVFEWDKVANPDFGWWRQVRPSRSGTWHLGENWLGVVLNEKKDEVTPLQLIATRRPCPAS